MYYIDIQTTFLNTNLKESIYIKLLKVFQNKFGLNKISLLLKILYGFKQLLRKQYQLLQNILLAIDFTYIHTNYSVFVYWNNAKPIYILIYIDDLLVILPSDKAIVEFKYKFTEYFELTNKEFIKRYLKIDVMRKGDKIYLF